jgi:hypothetical protein
MATYKLLLIIGDHSQELPLDADPHECIEASLRGAIQRLTEQYREKNDAPLQWSIASINWRGMPLSLRESFTAQRVPKESLLVVRVDVDNPFLFRVGESLLGTDRVYREKTDASQPPEPKPSFERLLETVVQLVREECKPHRPNWETPFVGRLRALVQHPLTDGQVLDADYLNILEARVNTLSDALGATQQELKDLQQRLGHLTPRRGKDPF